MNFSSIKLSLKWDKENGSRRILIILLPWTYIFQDYHNFEWGNFGNGAYFLYQYSDTAIFNHIPVSNGHFFKLVEYPWPILKIGKKALEKGFWGSIKP